MQGLVAFGSTASQRAGVASAGFKSAGNCTPFTPLSYTQQRFFPKMTYKRYRRPLLRRTHPRVQAYLALKQEQYAKRRLPVQPMRLEPDRPRVDKDPDPFNIKQEPEKIYKPQLFESWPLHPGIRSDQLRYGFTAADIEACGVDPSSEDFRLISRALSHHNSNSSEIRRQLTENEKRRWRRNDLDTASIEIKICLATLKLRSLKRHNTEFPKDYYGKDSFEKTYHRRRRMMHGLRKYDFGRYKKVMTYLGLRDRFNESLLSPGTNKMAHVHSKRKPPGGRRGHIW